jgi:hypothetical protein
MEVHSGNIRAILMYYYRFKRQFIACSEVKTDFNELSDVLILTKKHILEIEIKTSKQDLFNGEARKQKHTRPNEKRLVNKFYVCVPSELIEDAKNWIALTNTYYGLIEFRTELAKKDFVQYENFIRIICDAKVLQPNYCQILKEKTIKRLSSALTSEYIGKIK